MAEAKTTKKVVDPVQEQFSKLLAELAEVEQAGLVEAKGNPYDVELLKDIRQVNAKIMGVIAQAKYKGITLEK